MKNFIISLVIIVIISVLAGVGFIYSGIFNVAATSKDTALLSWVLSTTREHSIESRYEKIVVPDDSVLNTPKMLIEGFEDYDEMCVVCHGAPGVDAGEAHEGLNPKPPLFAKLKDLAEDPPGEIFWIIKNGIKMTGMPAWGPTHSDDRIWAMTMFVRKLPSMSAAEYKALKQQLAGSEHGEHKHEHEH